MSDQETEERSSVPIYPGRRGVHSQRERRAFPADGAYNRTDDNKSRRNQSTEHGTIVVDQNAGEDEQDAADEVVR